MVYTEQNEHLYRALKIASARAYFDFDRGIGLVSLTSAEKLTSLTLALGRLLRVHASSTSFFDLLYSHVPFVSYSKTLTSICLLDLLSRYHVLTGVHIV